MPAVIVAIAEIISDSALLKVISFAAAGIYIAFQLVVLAALIARSPRLGPARASSRSARWGCRSTSPRSSTASAARSTSPGRAAATRSRWTDKWIVVIGCAIVVGSGVLYMLLGRPYARGTSPAGDAVSAR